MKKISQRLRKIYVKEILMVSAMVVAVWIIQPNFEIVVNRSESLPIHAVIIKKGKLPTKLDQIIVFKVRNNPHYKMKEMNFIKLVGGFEGDKIEKRGGVVMKDGKPVFRTIFDGCEIKNSDDSCDKPVMYSFAPSDPLFNPYKDENTWYQSFKSPAADAIEKRKSLNMEITDKTVSVAGKEIGVIKAWSKKTEPLSAIQSGIIPSNKFFAYTTHKDSFDSRYNDLGLIDAKDIIGTAIVAF